MNDAHLRLYWALNDEYQDRSTAMVEMLDDGKPEDQIDVVRRDRCVYLTKGSV